MLTRYLALELARAWVAVSLVLILVLMGSAVAALLWEVADGSLPMAAVGIVLSVQMLELWVNLAPMSTILSIVLGLGRLYRDSEMAAVFSSGYGGWRLLSPLAFALLPILAVHCWVALDLLPLMRQAEMISRHNIHPGDSLARLRPGVLQEVDGNTVIYVGGSDLDNGAEQLTDIFLYRADGHEIEVESAPVASYQINDERREVYLQMQEGNILRLREGRREYLQYARHAQAVGAENSTADLNTPRLMRLHELLNSPRRLDHLELHWRLAMTASAVVLALLGLPLTHLRPRQQPFLRMIVGVFAYLVLANSAVYIQDLLQRQPTLPLWYLHAGWGSFLIFSLWFYRRRLLRC